MRHRAHPHEPGQHRHHATHPTHQHPAPHHRLRAKTMPRTRILRQDAGLGAEIAHALSQQAAADQAFLATPGSYYRLGAF